MLIAGVIVALVIVAFVLLVVLLVAKPFGNQGQAQHDPNVHANTGHTVHQAASVMRAGIHYLRDGKWWDFDSWMIIGCYKGLLIKKYFLGWLHIWLIYKTNSKAMIHKEIEDDLSHRGLTRLPKLESEHL